MTPVSSTASILVPLGQFIYIATIVYVWVIIARVLLSWVSPNPYTPVMRFLIKATDPVLNWARRVMPLTLGGIDFSPILAIIILQLSGIVLGQWIRGIGLGAPISILLPLLAFALVNLLSSLAWLLMIIMGLRLIISLVHPSPYNILFQIIHGLSEPLLAPLRRFFPAGPAGLDIRALVFLLILFVIDRVVLGSIAMVVGRWMGGITVGLG